MSLSLCHTKSRRSRWCFCQSSLENHMSPKNLLFYFCLITESWALWNPGSCRCLFQHRWQSGPAGLMKAWTVTMECRPFLSGCSRCMMTSSFEYIPGQNFKPFRSACVTILIYIFYFILFIYIVAPLATPQTTALIISRTWAPVELQGCHSHLLGVVAADEVYVDSSIGDHQL